MLVVQALAAAPAPARRRRKPRPEEQGAVPELPLSRATAIRAARPFASQPEAEAWLKDAVADEERIDSLRDEGIGLVNRAMFAQAAARADPNLAVLSSEAAIAVRIGFGEGEEVAAGRYTLAHRVNAATGGSRRRRRDEELRPQERVAAVLGRRERIDACEVLVLRARADLDGDRPREAALQLRVGLEALLVELDGALADPGHEQDMTELRARRAEVGELANEALRGDLDEGSAARVRELVEIGERVLRRRRVLRGG